MQKRIYTNNAEKQAAYRFRKGDDPIYIRGIHALLKRMHQEGADATINTRGILGEDEHETIKNLYRYLQTQL